MIAKLKMLAITGGMTLLPMVAEAAPRCWWFRACRPSRPRPSVQPVVSAPEIDASAGLLALAATAVVLLFVWELRRRRAQA